MKSKKGAVLPHPKKKNLFSDKSRNKGNMRRAAFYMGRTYTTRHLNATRSPLMTGFISSAGLSMTQCAFSTSPLRAMPSGLSEEAEISLAAASELMLEAGGCNAALSGFGSIRSPFAVACSGRAMATGVTSALCGKVILSLPMEFGASAIC